MFKILSILFLLQSSIRGDLPKIKLIGIENPSCSSLLGRLDFQAKCRYDSLPSSDSYFILNFKDSSNNKHSSICRVTNPDIPRPTSLPIQSTEPTVPPTGEIAPVPPTGEIAPVPTTEEIPPVPTTEEIPPLTDSLFTDTPQTDEVNIDPFDPEYEKFRDILLKLRLRIEDNIIDTNEDVNSTINSFKELQPLILYKTKEELKNFTLKLDMLDLKLHNFSEKFIYPIIDESLLKLKEFLDLDLNSSMFSFNFSELFNISDFPFNFSDLFNFSEFSFNFSEFSFNFSEKFCSFTKEFVKAGSKDNTIFNIIRKDLQEKNVTKLLEEKREKLNATFESFKKNAKEKVDSPLVNDLLDEISKLGEMLDKEIDKSQIEELIEQMRQWEEFKENPIPKTKELLKRLQIAFFEQFIDEVNSTMIEFDVSLIDNLLKIQKLIDLSKNGSLIEDLLKENNETDSLDGLKDLIKDKIDFLDDSVIGNIIKDNFEQYKDEVVKKLKDVGIYEHIEEVSEKIEELKELGEILKNDTIQESLYEFFQLITTLNDAPPMPELFNLSGIDILEQVKNLTLVQTLVENLIDSLNTSKAEEEREKIMEEKKNTINSIEQKIDEFLNDDSSLKGIKEELLKVKNELVDANVFKSLNNFSQSIIQLEDAYDQKRIHNMESLRKALYIIDEKLKKINRTEILEEIKKAFPINITNIKDLDNQDIVCELLIEKLKNLDIDNITETVKNEIIKNITLLQQLTNYDNIKNKIEKLINDFKANHTDFSPLKDALLNYTFSLEEFLDSIGNLISEEQNLTRIIYDVKEKIKEIDGQLILEKLNSNPLYLWLKTNNKYEKLALLSYYYSLIVNNQTNTTDPFLLILEKLIKDLDTKIQGYQRLNSDGYILYHEFLSSFDKMKNSLKDFAPGLINQTIYLLLDRLNNTNLTNLLSDYMPQFDQLIKMSKNGNLTSDGEDPKKVIFDLLEEFFEELYEITEEPYKDYVKDFKEKGIISNFSDLVFSTYNLSQFIKGLKNNYEQLALLSYYYSLFVNNQTNTTNPYYEKLFKDLATKYQGLNSDGYILYHEFLSKLDTMKNSLKDFAPGLINQTIYLLLDRLNNTNLTNLLSDYMPQFDQLIKMSKNGNLTSDGEDPKKVIFDLLEEFFEELYEITEEPYKDYVKDFKEKGIISNFSDLVFSTYNLFQFIKGLKNNYTINDSIIFDNFEKMIGNLNGSEFIEILEMIMKPLQDLQQNDFDKFKEDAEICLDALKEKTKNSLLLAPIVNKIIKEYEDIILILEKAGVPDKLNKYLKSKDRLKSQLNETINDIFDRLKSKFNYTNNTNMTSFNLTESLKALSAQIFDNLEKTKQLVKQFNASNLVELKNDILNFTCIFCDWKNQTIFDEQLISNKTLEYIKSRIDLVFTLYNFNASDPIEEHLYKFKEQLEKLNGTEFILELNKTLFNISEEVINVLNNITEVEEFNKRLMSILNATLYFETNKTLDDLENDLNYFIEMLKENSLKGIIKKINNSLYTCDYDYIEEITGFKKLKDIFYSIKNFTTKNDETNKTLIREKLEIIAEDLQSHIITYIIGDERFKVIQKLVKEINDTIMDALDNIGLDDFVDDLRKKIEELKELIEKAEEEEEINDISYKLKDLNYSQILDAINSTFQQYKEEIHNLREIEYFSEKIRYILEKVNLKGLVKEEIDKISETLEEAKEKAEKLNKTILAKIYEEIKIQFEEEAEENEEILDDIEIQVDLFLDDCNRLEKKIREFPDEDEKEEYEKAKEKLTKSLNMTNIIDKMDDYVTREIDKLNETLFYISEFMDLVREKIKNIPEDKKEEFDDKMKELFKENTEELNKFIKENGHILDLIGTLNDDSSYGNTLKDFLENLKNSTEEFKERVQKIESIEDLIKNIRKDEGSEYRKQLDLSILKRYSLLDLFDFDDLGSNIKKLINGTSSNLDPEKIRDEIGNEIGNIITKIKNFNTNSKDSLDNLSSDLSSLVEKLNSDFGNLIDLLRNKKENIEDKNLLNLTSLLQELSNLNLKDEKIKDETEKIKNIVSLIKEVNELLNNPQAQKVLEALLSSGLLKKRVLSEKKEIKVKKQKKSKKLAKKKEKLRRIESDGTFDCKLDQLFTSPDVLTAYAENINSKVLLDGNYYDIDVEDNMVLNLGENEIGCSNSSVSVSKENVKYINHTDPQKDTQNNRIVYDLNADINDSFEIPQFFYLLNKVKVTFNNGTEGEVDSYCVIEDSSDRRNSKFKCYAYPEKFDDYKVISDIDSDYIQIPDSSNSTDNGSPSINYFRKGSSNGLSAGAIVGIILACLAVLIAILVTIILVNKSARPAVVAATTTDSQNHLQVANYSGQYGQGQYGQNIVKA